MLHSVGTHPVQEQCVTLAVTMRRGVLNNMSSEILNSAVPRETCRWPTVYLRPGHAPTFAFFPPPELFHQGALGDSLCHLHTLLGMHSVICFLSAVIWSPWLTRFRYCDRSPKHDKASRSITELNLDENQIGDDGARALADAVKAILVRWL